MQQINAENTLAIYRQKAQEALSQGGLPNVNQLKTPAPLTTPVTQQQPAAGGQLAPQAPTDFERKLREQFNLVAPESQYLGNRGY